jgi:hypothetical protein
MERLKGKPTEIQFKPKATILNALRVIHRKRKCAGRPQCAYDDPGLGNMHAVAFYEANTQRVGGPAMRICIVSSSGGHLTEVRMLRAAYARHPHFYVLNKQILLPPDMKDNTYIITHSERDMKVFLNLWEGFRILQRERPDVILSTGAGPVVPLAIVGRVFFHTRVIFVETITRIEKPSLTGRLMYWLAHDFFYQWPDLARYFPKAKYGGPLV